MAKVVVQFCCSECGATAGRWLGRCPGCGAFGTLVEELHGADGRAGSGAARTPERLGDVQLSEATRLQTGVPELDRVLGGGLVPASLVLVGGEPGVGKSTLLLSALGAIARSGRSALLVTGEESVAQVRLGRTGSAAPTTCPSSRRPSSRPSARPSSATGQPSRDQLRADPLRRRARIRAGLGRTVREAASRLLRVAKQSGVATVLVGHVTKDGAVAGPRVAEHLVDCVLQFEGDRYHAHRVLRAVKNRFGSTNERGVRDDLHGLVGVPDSSALFGATRPGEVGAAVAVALEGTRPILLEIQALVSRTDLAMPRRVGTGVDPKRLAMIVAVLARHAGVPLGTADVFVNVAGGVRIDEPGADLAVALAIASAARGAPVRDGVAAFGELGLTGRLRAAAQAERRLDECAKLGIGTAVVAGGDEGAKGTSADRRGRDDPRRAPRCTGAGSTRWGGRGKGDGDRRLMGALAAEN